MSDVTWRGTVAILGNGPSAAYAYRACIDNGITPHVLASGKPSFPRGAFWLHWLPPTIPEELQLRHRTMATLVGIGSAEVYSGKMWAETFETSFPEVARIEEAYSPEALELLWGGLDEFEECGIVRDAGVEELASQYDLVLQTFPTDASRKLSLSPVFFPVVSRPLPLTKDVLCLYNGTADKWVRMTVGFGFMHFELPHGELPSPVEWPSHIWRTFKYPDMRPSQAPLTRSVAHNVVLLGRHARWDRRLLSHSAYENTVAALRRMGGEK